MQYYSLESPLLYCRQFAAVLTGGVVCCASTVDIYQLPECHVDTQSSVCVHCRQSVGSHNYHSGWLHTAWKRFAITCLE